MGLDISAYGGTTLIGTAESYDAYEDNYRDIDHTEYVRANEPYHAAQFAGLTADGVYRIDPARHLHFRAGSYGGYNDWREELCTMVHGVAPAVIWESPEAWQDKPFFYLINFSDCEGTIGAEVSAKLAADSSEYQTMADNYTCGEMTDWFRAKYADWRKAFDLAADNGFVIFR